MKKEKGISLIVLTLIIVAILVIGTVAIVLAFRNNNGQNEKENTSSLSNNNDLVEKNEENNDKNEETALKSKFWVDDYKNWGEQKENFTLTLFDGKFTTPINLKTIDNFAKQYSCIGPKEKLETTSIIPILNSEEVIRRDVDTTIWVYYGELNEHNNYINSLRIDVENFNDTDTTLKECIENNWWYIEEDIYPADRTLGIDMTNETDYNEDSNAKPLLDKVVNELGAPKHIYVTERSSNGRFETIEYLLSYEYDNYSVVLEVSESLYNGMNQQFIIKSITYYNNICRDKKLEKLKQYYELNPNSSIKFEIMK